MGVLEICNGCPGDIFWVSLRYFIGVLEMFDRWPGDIGFLSWRYTDLCPGDT